MANEKNLEKGKATRIQSGEEAARKGRKGGKASGASRRRHKSLQETMLMVSKLPLDDIGLNRAKRTGIDITGVDEYDMTALTAVVLGQVRAAANGNSQAAQVVAEWMDLATKHKRDQLEIEKLKAEIDRLKMGSGMGDQDNEFLNAWKQSIIDGFKGGES